MRQNEWHFDHVRILDSGSFQIPIWKWLWGFSLAGRGLVSKLDVHSKKTTFILRVYFLDGILGNDEDHWGSEVP